MRAAAATATAATRKTNCPPMMRSRWTSTRTVTEKTTRTMTL